MTKEEKIHERVAGALGNAAAGYWGIVEDFAQEVAESVIHPFCKRNDLSFLSGNGTWYFLRGEETVFTDLGGLECSWCSREDHFKASEDAPEGWQDVLDALYIDVPMNNGYTLGTMMPGFDP